MSQAFSTPVCLKPLQPDPPCWRYSKYLCPGERDSAPTAFPVPSISLYLGKSCNTSRPLSQGDGRGTPWDRSPVGSPGGHPDRCTRCRAGVQRSGKLGATPPHGSMSSHCAHRLGQGGREGRRVSATDLGQSPRNGWGQELGEPLLHRTGPATLPAKWRPGIKRPRSLPSPLLQHSGLTPAQYGPSVFLLKMESSPPALPGHLWQGEFLDPVLFLPGSVSSGRSLLIS